MAGTGKGYLKIGVIGAIERKGNVVCRIIGDAEASTLAGFVRKVISDRIELVATDDNQDYNYIGRGIRHESVTHSRGEYVRGEIHTNSIESFLGFAQARNHRDVSQRERQISAALPERISVSV